MKTLITTSLVALVALVAGLNATPAQAGPSSGMLLGVYAFENWQGLRVTGTIPGYSADGRLFANDILLRATTDGVNIYSIRTHQQIEWAKDQIGPNTPAAIEVWRPGVGTIYFWVEFMPVGGGVQAYAYQHGGVQPKVQHKAMFQTEAEKPGAKLLFQGGKGGFQGGFHGPQPKPGVKVNPMLPVGPGSLFGN